MREAFGAKKVIWIDEGLKNDHTDGHIDNIARFVGPGRVVCQSPAGADDPNAETLEAIARALEAATDAQGRKLEVIRIPGVGLYRNALGEIVAGLASEFRHRQRRGGVPVYGTPTRSRCARCACRRCFPAARWSACRRAGCSARRRRRRLVPLHHAAGAGVMASRTITVAAIQTSFGPDMAANIAKIEGFVREAAQARRASRAAV